MKRCEVSREDLGRFVASFPMEAGLMAFARSEGLLG